ncbi:MAG: hypothetical protein JWM02_350 [Frankiales bacterium]|nr:hypothetical protein [Frankiales bacterium]
MSMQRPLRRGVQRTALLGAGALLLGAFPVLTAATPASAAVPGKVSGAVQTTNVDATSVNQNQYLAKTDVYLSGGPNNTSAHFLAEGDYFFAILVPGGQSDPNDGGDGNLSDPLGGTAAERSFHADGHGIATPIVGATNLALHPISPAGVIQAADFADTTNSGGVYLAAVCQYAPVANGTAAQHVVASDCKYDAFKVGEGVPPGTVQVAPAAEKTADPSHHRTVTWTLGKTVGGAASQTYLAPSKTVSYAVTATKSATETYGVTGTITVSNSNDSPLDVIISENGLSPASTDSCTLDNSTGFLTVPGKVGLDPGQNSVDYTCTFSSAPDTSASYTNTATVTYDLGDGLGDQDLPVASNPFDFPAATLTAGSDPETISVNDAFNGGTAALLSPATASDTYTWSYSRTLSNSNCVTYPNTATIVETGAHASASVTLCGPNSGGLTMGWWQNKNGQALLKANTAAACGTVNGYLPALGSHGALNYLPDAYTSAKSPASAYYYDSAACTTLSAKSYLPTFDLNVFSVAAAAGTGTKMVEGQWLTTALDTATYVNSSSAGKPTLSAGQKVIIPSALQTGLGLATCDTVGHLLTASAGQYSGYASSKTAITAALIPLFTAINQSQAQTCI